MNKMLVEAPEGEPIIRMTRTFDAPRALVWRAWTRPEHVARWWGSRAMGTTKVVKLDLRTGGEWRFEHTMHDGSVFAFIGKYLEVDEPEKLVNTFALEGMFDDRPVVEPTASRRSTAGRTTPASPASPASRTATAWSPRAWKPARRRA